MLVFISWGSVTSLDAFATSSVVTDNYVHSKFMGDYDDQLFSSIHEQLKPGKIGLAWKSRLYGEMAELQTQSAQIGGAEINLASQYKLLESLEARVNVRAKFENGRAQSFFGDLEPLSGILLREAVVKYMPVNEISLRLGVIDQDALDMPLLMSRRSFPGGAVDLKGDWTQEFSTTFTSQLLIPTSSTLSTRTVDKEATPQFTTQTVSAEYNKKTDSGDHHYSLKLSGSLYEFKNLPSFVAFESQKRGNILPGNGTQVYGPNNSVFAYPFKGWFARAFADYKINGLLQPYAAYSVIKNNEAPETYNDGHLISVGTVVMFSDYNWFVSYENFFAESDVVPGFYSSLGYGNTNKKGSGIDTSIEFKKYNFRIRAQYYKADVLNPDGLQQDQDYFYLGVETAYEKI